MAFPPIFDRAFDETFPPDTQLANLLGQDIRNLKTDIRERFALLSGTLANRPVNMDALFGGVNYGTLYFSTDTSQVFQWNGGAWVDISVQLFGINSGGAQGNPRIVNTLNLTAQAAAIAPTNLYTVPGGQSGVYRLVTKLITTVVGTGGFFNLTITWNNGFGPISVNAASVSTQILGAEGGFGGGTVATAENGIYVPAAQSITYAIAFSGVTGAPQYSFLSRLEYLG